MNGPGQPGPAERAEGLVREGRALFAVGDLARARECFDRALALVPDDRAAHAGRDRCDRLMAEAGSGAGVTPDDEETPEVTDTPGAEAEAEPDTDGPDSEQTARAPKRAAGRGAALLDDFPDADQQQEETVVDPMAALEMEEEIERERARRRKEQAQGPQAQGPPAQGPPAQGPQAQGPPAQGPPAQGPPAQGPPAQGPAQGPAQDPSYPRYVAGAPGNYPEVIKGPSPAPVGPPGAPPGPGSYVVDYPQVVSGQGYARYATPVGPAHGAAPPYRAVMLTPELRRRWIAIGAGAAVASSLLGLLLGWAIFGGDDDAGEPAAAAAAGPAATASAAPPDAGCSPAAGSALPHGSCGDSRADAGAA